MTTVSPTTEETIVIGSIVGVHGLGGWLKVRSWSDPPEQLMDYSPLIIGESIHEAPTLKPHKKGLMMKLPNLDDRTAVESLVGMDILIRADQLPDAGADQYYWHQLIGLTVIDQHARTLGRISRMLETGANDVMVVSRDPEDSRIENQQLIPYVMGQYVTRVDLDQGQLHVDWED